MAIHASLATIPATITTAITMAHGTTGAADAATSTIDSPIWVSTDAPAPAAAADGVCRRCSSGSNRHSARITRQ